MPAVARPLHAPRARFFSPAESKGMFGFSDAEDMDTLARMEIRVCGQGLVGA
ncbi:lipase secretion chaperone [Collimonas sp.]|uniref:lipase secretion chaperone n=1 Tax=Collimonas sp. TaxID=1963772 RepID=UPI0032C229E7